MSESEYHNAATGQSTWSLLQPSERPPPPPLPFGWIAEWDDTNGRYYYYNAETRTSVWVPPVPLPPLHSCHTKLPSASIQPCKCFPPHVLATGSCPDLLKDDSAAGGLLGGQAEGERGCCGAVGVGSRACTFSLEPARSGSAVTQEVAHHPGLSVDEQPACPGCRARPFGVPSPFIACGRCGQAPTEHCARCCPTGTQDLARHEARFQQALDETIQEALGQDLTPFADHSMFSIQKLDQWLLHHHIKADAMEIMACEQRWRHLKRVQGDPDDASRPSEEAVAINRQQQLAAASSSQHQQAAASSCQQWPQQPATSVEMQNEWAYADVVTGWIYGRYDVRPVGLQLRLVGTRRAIPLCDRPAPPPEASARADPRLVCQLPKVHGWDLVSAELRSHVARQTTEEEQEQQRRSSRGASSRSSGRAWSRMRASRFSPG